MTAAHQLEQAQRDLPRFLDHGYPCKPTSGDVDAVWEAAVRLFRGEVIKSCSAATGARISVRMKDMGYTLVREEGCEPVAFPNAHDALVYAHGRIGDFNLSWNDFMYPQESDQ